MMERTELRVAVLENGLNNLNYGQVQIDTTVYID
eukprot:COSAG05_NODE_20396_length_280_cov_0.342541_2_plen_33_part_01